MKIGRISDMFSITDEDVFATHNRTELCVRQRVMRGAMYERIIEPERRS
jgi:hypothetical protein